MSHSHSHPRFATVATVVASTNKRRFEISALPIEPTSRIAKRDSHTSRDVTEAVDCQTMMSLSGVKLLFAAGVIVPNATAARVAEAIVM